MKEKKEIAKEWKDRKCWKCCKNKVFVDKKHYDTKYHYCRDCLLGELSHLFWESLTKTLPKKLRTEVVLENFRSCGVYYYGKPKEKEDLIRRMDVDI